MGRAHEDVVGDFAERQPQVDDIILCAAAFREVADVNDSARRGLSGRKRLQMGEKKKTRLSRHKNDLNIAQISDSKRMEQSPLAHSLMTLGPCPAYCRVCRHLVSSAAYCSVQICQFHQEVRGSEFSCCGSRNLVATCNLFPHEKSHFLHQETHGCLCDLCTNCTEAGLFSISVALRPRVLCRIPSLILLMAPINSVLAAVRQ